MPSLLLPQDASICIVGTVRNGGKTLDRDIKRLSQSTEIFSSRQFFIVESDSDDSTVSVLKRLGDSRRDFEFQTCGRLAERMPLRTQRISFCRNLCVSFVKRSSQKFNFVLVADLDGINSKVNRKSLLSCWDMPVEWDVCTGNRAGRYYDIFALRCAGWVEEDCIRQAKSLSTRIAPNLARYLTTEAKMVEIPHSHPPIKVESAFGGVGLYRAESFLQGQYMGLDELGEETCEHVEFHRKLLENGAKIYINPRMIVGGTKEFLGKNFLRALRS